MRTTFTNLRWASLLILIVCGACLTPSSGRCDERAADESSLPVTWGTARPVTPVEAPVLLVAEETPAPVAAPVAAPAETPSTSDANAPVTWGDATPPVTAWQEPAEQTAAVPEAKPEEHAASADKPEPAPKVEEQASTAEPAAQPAAKIEPAPEKESTYSYGGASTTNKVKPRFTGRFRLEYEYKKQGSESDADLYGYWSYGAYDLGGGHFDFYTSGRVHSDVGGHTATGTNDPYTSPYVTLGDTAGVTDQRILQLYGDLHDRAKHVSLRAGRQYIDVADYLHIDGAQLMLYENEAFGGRVYAGQPVSYYSSVSGDFASGFSLVGKPWEGNRSRIAFARYYESSVSDSDQNYFADVQQELTDSIRSRGQVSVLNGDFRLARIDLTYFSPDGETDFLVGGSRWGSFDAKTRAYSPLYNTLGQQDPYSYAYAKLMVAIARSVMVAPSVSYRLVDSGDQNTSNQNYKDYELALIYEPSHAFSSSIALQYWDVENSDKFFGLTGDVRYRYLKLWEVSGGASYSQYTYNTVSDISYSVNNGQTVVSDEGSVSEETPYVYTYFLQGKWRFTPKLILKVQGDIEDDKSVSDLSYRMRVSMEVRL